MVVLCDYRGYLSVDAPLSLSSQSGRGSYLSVTFVGAIELLLSSGLSGRRSYLSVTVIGAIDLLLSWLCFAAIVAN